MDTTTNQKQQFFLLSVDDLENTLSEIVEKAITNHFDKQKEDRLITISQAAKMLGVDKSTLWKWDKENYLRKIHIGGKPRYHESEVMAILEGKR